MKATDLLKKDHNAIKRLFTEFGKTTARATRKRRELVGRIVQALEVHARIEEEIFYPAMEQVEAARGMLEHSREEHQEMKELLGEIRDREPSGREIAEQVQELKQTVQDHVSEEEQELFAHAEQLGDEELERLGVQMEGRRQELQPAARRTRRAA